jgi:hypothetical protein
MSVQNLNGEGSLVMGVGPLLKNRACVVLAEASQRKSIVSLRSGFMLAIYFLTHIPGLSIANL